MGVSFVLSLCSILFSCGKKNIHQDEGHNLSELLRLSLPSVLSGGDRDVLWLGLTLKELFAVLGDLETRGSSQL